MIRSKRVALHTIFFFAAFTSAFFAYKYFHIACPFVQTSISMDRHQAVASAKELAKEMHADVEASSIAVEFASDTQLQSFVELEGGGKQAFIDMFESGTYYPYQWRVRFFKENQVDETSVWYTPHGKKWGFLQTISEEAPGASLSRTQAQNLAEAEAKKWYENFSLFSLVEYESEKRDSGRVDHSFVYERSDETLEKGLYRLKLEVRGDAVTGLVPYVKIPDNFIRRFQEMRSDNMLLTFVSHFLYRFLYLFLFGLIGLIFLYRRNWLLWRPASIGACIVAGLFSLGILNNLPLSWMAYNTVQSKSAFVVSQLLQTSIMFFMIFGMLFFALLIAEGAGRFIFKQHIQFWKIFSWKTLSSYEVLWQIIYAYLFVMLMFGYIVLFYYIAQVHWGWWTPLDNLADPNMLASYMPWFGSFSKAWFAGFQEEVIFRALPFAVVMIIARNSNHKGFWLLGVFLLQALIFGACHAFYPMQPFYARVIELIIPSFGFGALYYVFGLLPGIIAHYLFDMLLMSIPLLISNFLLQKIIVVALLAAPLAVVLFARVMQGGFSSLSAVNLSKSWKLKEVKETIVKNLAYAKSIPVMQEKAWVVLSILLAVGGVWFYQVNFDTKPITVTKQEVIDVARNIIAKEFTELSSDWHPFVSLQNNASSLPSRFVWQNYGKKIYDQLQGMYINDPAWFVRFINFNTSVEDRREEYTALIASDGKVVTVNHVLPEHVQGADLKELPARKVAQAFLFKRFALTVGDVELLSFDSKKLENRRDWVFVFQDKEAKILESDIAKDKKGQARITVEIAGDKVVGYHCTMYPAESWRRGDQGYLMQLGLLKSVFGILFLLLLGFGFFLGVYRLMYIPNSLTLLTKVAAGISFISVASLINDIPNMMGMFTTASPFYHQLIQSIILHLFHAYWMVLVYAVMVTVGILGFVRIKNMWTMQAVRLIVFSTISMVAVFSMIRIWYPTMLEPGTVAISFLNSYSPFVSILCSTIIDFYSIFSFFSALFLCVEFFQTAFPHWRGISLVISILFSLAFTTIFSLLSIGYIFIFGLLFGLYVYAFYYFVLRYDMSLLPWLAFGICLSSALRSGFFAQPCIGSMILYGSSILLVGFLTVGMRKILYSRS